MRAASWYKVYFVLLTLIFLSLLILIFIQRKTLNNFVSFSGWYIDNIEFYEIE